MKRNNIVLFTGIYRQQKQWLLASERLEDAYQNTINSDLSKRPAWNDA